MEESVDVGNQDGERQAPPKFLDVGLDGGAVYAGSVYDLRVGVFLGIVALDAEHGGR
jgi:hypothetical protein